MPMQTNTKTLYTPVFFSSSEPPRGSNRSSASANLKVPSAYLNSLSRTHIALAQIVREEPSSRPGSPTEDADGSYPDLFTQERVSALRAHVQEAWAKTDGNPADGKWTALTHLLRIGVTSGKVGRWAGTRADLKAPDPPDGGWINAATEIEWTEWEKRVNVKDKVENWKMRLETHEELASQIIKDTPNASNAKSSDREQVRADASLPALSIAKVADSTPVLAAAQPNLKLTSESVVTTNSDPLKDKSLFGFAVVKRSNASAAAVGKKPHVDPKSANQQPKDAPPADTAQPIRKIVDVPEMSFLAPSFPYSQIITSTPNTKLISSDKHKPEPIPFTASPIESPVSPSLSSPRVTKVYGRQKKSTSLPATPSSLPLPPVPTTPSRNNDDTINDNNKRQLFSPDRAVKKARTMPSLGSSPVVAGFGIPQDDPLPTTPKRQNLPTLTELLASAKKGKKLPKGLKPKSAEEESIPKFRPPSPLPDLEDNPYMLDPYAISVNHSALDPDISPTKSLSSLAGSDSEDEDDGVNHQSFDFSPSSFNPYATSTQHQNYPHGGYAITSSHSNPFLRDNGKAGTVLSLGFGGYNSQFDVAGQVDKVDKLLEKDVDYEGWLRDPSLEREGIRAEEESP